MTKIRFTSKPEQKIKSEIKQYLNSKGIYWCPTKGTAGTRGGDADLVICYRGFFIGVEGKTDVGRQHGQQPERQEQIERNDGYYIIARSVADVVAVLKEIDLNIAKLEDMI